MAACCLKEVICLAGGLRCVILCASWVSLLCCGKCMYVQGVETSHAIDLVENFAMSGASWLLLGSAAFIQPASALQRQKQYLNLQLAPFNLDRPLIVFSENIGSGMLLLIGGSHSGCFMHPTLKKANAKPAELRWLHGQFTTHPLHQAATAHGKQIGVKDV